MESQPSPLERTERAASIMAKSLRVRSAWLSAAFVALWLVVLGLLYFRGPLWLCFVLSVVGVAIALYDRVHIRRKAHSAVLLRKGKE